MGIIEYYTIFAWMRDELKLSDAELDCYAIIYNLSHSGNKYIAGVKRLMETLHKSEPTIIAALKHLTEKGLVVKETVITNNVKRNYYTAIRPAEDTPKEILGTTLNNLSNPTLNNLSSINNINNIENKNNKNRLSNDNQKVVYSEDFLSFWSIYHEGSKQQAYKEWKKLKDKEKEKALNLVDNYLKLCLYSGRKKKDVSSYLHQHGFDEDWLETPDCYVVKDGDNERMVKFKNYMVSKHIELIFHRNPITFEQLDECFTRYTYNQTEWAMNKLKQRDIHQYFSILKGIEAVINDNSEFEEEEDEQ